MSGLFKKHESGEFFNKMRKHKMENNKKKPSIKTLAIIGYAMYFKGMSKEELDGLSNFNTLMLCDEYEEFILKSLLEEN